MTDCQAEHDIRRAVAGDRDALSLLLEQLGPLLKDRFRDAIASPLRSMLEVDDVLQVTFLEVFLRISHFVYRGPGSFEAWVTRIAHNNLTDAVRSLRSGKQPPPQQRLPNANPVDSSIALLNVLGVTSGTPSRRAQAEELHRQVQEAVAGLPSDYAQVVTAHDLEGRAIKEVATSMHRTTGAVYMLRARALEFLRETLGGSSNFAR